MMYVRGVNMYRKTSLESDKFRSFLGQVLLLFGFLSNAGPLWAKVIVLIIPRVR